MAEFAAFHYLMHKKGDSGPSRPAMSMDDFSKQFGGAKAKLPPTFDELYSPRERRQIHCGEKLFWRTNERLEIRLFEARKSKVLLALVFNITSNEEYRPICIDLVLLYQIIENKKQNRSWSEPMEKRMLVDNELKSSAQDFILSRLKLSEKDANPEEQRHCYLDKSFGDEYSTLTLSTLSEENIQQLLEGIERKGKPIWLSQKSTEVTSQEIPDTNAVLAIEKSVEPPEEPKAESPSKATGGSGANAAKTLKKLSPAKQVSSVKTTTKPVKSTSKK